MLSYQIFKKNKKSKQYSFEKVKLNLAWEKTRLIRFDWINFYLIWYKTWFKSGFRSIDYWVDLSFKAEFNNTGLKQLKNYYELYVIFQTMEIIIQFEFMIATSISMWKRWSQDQIYSSKLRPVFANYTIFQHHVAFMKYINLRTQTNI
jgi:hypothetical protein